METETFDKVKQLIIDTLNFDDSEIKPESSFADDLKADSLDVVELMMAVEENFGVKIPDEELQNMKTVKDVCEYIDAHKEA
jgi:acyl carrier protein